MNDAKPPPDHGAAVKPTRVVLVTGLSGAGRSMALNALEDLGYEAVDNLPISLLGALLRPGDDAVEVPEAVAVTVDIRSRGFAAEALESQLARLVQRQDMDVSLLFLDCDDAILARRFTETRRRHPLARDRAVMDGIRRERRLMFPVRELADLVLDSSELTPGDLRRLISDQYGLAGSQALTLTVTSFSYRLGLPRESDLVFDVRFLANPHYLPELKPQTGQDPGVGEYIAADPAFGPFFDRLGWLLLSLLPHYGREGKSYLTVAVGCTGGRHRSVYVAERLAAFLTREGHPVNLRHRDLERYGGNTGDKPRSST